MKCDLDAKPVFFNTTNRETIQEREERKREEKREEKREREKERREERREERKREEKREERRERGPKKCTVIDFFLFQKGNAMSFNPRPLSPATIVSHVEPNVGCPREAFWKHTMKAKARASVERHDP